MYGSQILIILLIILHTEPSQSETNVDETSQFGLSFRFDYLTFANSGFLCRPPSTRHIISLQGEAQRYRGINRDIVFSQHRLRDSL